ncbi:hypothetical protein ACFYSF_25315 [Streptomyces canus]|uniref:hypothetical protein n=1 Tax=Streptomyces canus TaxID=58343 RepID=UPI00367E6D4C
MRRDESTEGWVVKRWQSHRGGSEGAHRSSHHVPQIPSPRSVAAAAISTALLLICVAVNLGFQQRADRIDWRTPVTSAAPVAVEAVGTTFSGGTPVTIVDVAQLPGKKAPAPPGMPRFPEPGEVWVSPALADLLHRLPADRHRVPGKYRVRPSSGGRRRRYVKPDTRQHRSMATATPS